MKEIIFLTLVFTIIGLKNASAMQTKEDVEHAIFIARSPYVFSPILHWITLEPFMLRDGSMYCAANSFNPNTKILSGEIAIYPYLSKREINQLANPLNDHGCFNKLASPFDDHGPLNDNGFPIKVPISPLYCLPYKFDYGKQYKTSSFSLMNVEGQEEEKYFFKLAEAYFLSKFVKKRTNASEVFSSTGECLFTRSMDGAQ